MDDLFGGSRPRETGAQTIVHPLIAASGELGCESTPQVDLPPGTEHGIAISRLHELQIDRGGSRLHCSHWRWRCDGDIPTQRRRA